MEATLKGLRPVDIRAWNRLLAETEKVVRTGEHYNEADPAEEMANPDIEPGKDMVGAFTGGELVGHFCAYPARRRAEVHRTAPERAVRPDVRGRGIGPGLAAAMRQGALGAHREWRPVGATTTTRREGRDRSKAGTRSERRDRNRPLGTVEAPRPGDRGP